MPKSPGRPPAITRERTRQHDDRPLPDATGDPTLDVTPPDDLTDDARVVWESTVPSLAKMGALTAGDLPMLVEFVSALALARACRKEYERGLARGTAVHVARGSGKTTEIPFLGSPNAKRIRSDWQTFVGVADTLAAQYGLTPTARVKLGLTVVQARSLSEALASIFEDDE